MERKEGYESRIHQRDCEKGKTGRKERKEGIRKEGKRERRQEGKEGTKTEGRGERSSEGQR